MNSDSFTSANFGSGRSDFDLFRLSKGKSEVDVCANTLRSYHAHGLPFYRKGRAVFISKSELAAFIRSRVTIGKSPMQEAKR